MAEQLCTQCGSHVPIEAVFCTKCGGRDLVASVSDPTAVAESPIARDAPTVPVIETIDSPFAPPPAPGSFAGSGDATGSRVDPWRSPQAPPPPTVAAPPFGPQSSSVPPPTQTIAMPPLATPPPVSAAQVPVGAPSLTPEQASSGGGKLGAVLALFGGAAAIVGAFLEWMKVTPSGATAVGFDGWSLTDDAKIVAGMGAVVIVVAVVVIGGAARQAMRLVTAVVGILIVGVGAYDTYDILRKLPDALEALGFQGLEIAAPGLGLILVLAGGVVVIVGSLAMAGPKKQVHHQGSPAEPSFATTPPGAAPFGGPPPPTGSGMATLGFGTAPMSRPPSGGFAPPPTS